MKSTLLSPLLALSLMASAVNAQHKLTVNTQPGAAIQPTMYGIFFEDINFGADGWAGMSLVMWR